MKPDKLKQLIEEVIAQFELSKEEGAQVFQILVKTTLAYRDVLKAESGTTLTVGETREALNLLLEFMSTRLIPRASSQKITQLVLLWIHELNLEQQEHQEESKTIH